MDETRSNIAHLYRRAGFGARPEELDAAVAAGYQATVDYLLAGLTRPDPAGDRVAPPQLSAYQPVAAGQDPVARMAANRQRQKAQTVEYQALQRWWLDRMIVTSTPLREKLTLLWHGHFATAFEKVRDASLMYRQNQLLRTQGAGNFESLTEAVAKDPAMMFWLDTQTNVAGHPNENFARELMELFTLGLGNYSEDDVKEGARCFTGWAFNRVTGAYVLRARLHDYGTKTFFGQTGTWNGEDVVRMVTNHPASARWIVAKLWGHLAYPVDTTDPLVADLVAGYRRDLDITNLLRAIFLRPEFTGPAARAGLVKQPIEFVVGVARAFGLDAAGSRAASAGLSGPGPAGPVGPGSGAASGAGPGPGGAAGSPGAAGAGLGGAAGMGTSGVTATTVGPPRRNRPALLALPQVLRQLAQEPFNPPNVGGWPQNGYWLNTATAQVRLQFGYAVGANADLSALTALSPAERPGALAHLLGIDGWGPTTLAALNHAVADPASLVALALSAPEYVLN